VSVDRRSVWPYVDGEPGEFLYSRYAHPTGVEAERRLAALEGAPDGQALLFSSGSAATFALLVALLEPGRTVALAEGCYFGTGVMMREELGRWGLKTVEFDQTGPPPDGVDLIWLEAPSNPFLTMPDLEAAAAHPARVVVDSTAATPVHLRPLDHGADFVLHSATKYLTGHSDALAGAIVSRDPADHQRLWQFRQRTGPACAADVAALVTRGLKTLRVRVERQTETARLLVERLERHPAVEHVRYPGFGGLLSFDVPGDPVPVERALRLIKNATSLGGVESTLESRHRWEGDRVPVGLLRLSVGLEDPDDLWADLEQALAVVS
jgi:cystathionine gamma-synthase